MFEKSMTRVIVGIRESIFYVCVCVVEGGGWALATDRLDGRLTNLGGFSPQTGWTGRLTNQGGWVLATDRLDRETNKSIQISLC